MGKNKAGVDRDQKREEIVAVARRLFLDAGYDATSMGRLAEEVGVAPNTIYWYFADKDTLLVAVLDAIVSEAMQELQRKRLLPLDAQVLWVLSLLEGAARLVGTVHARTASSEALRTWHDNFHRLVEAVLVAELRARGVSEDDAPNASRVATLVVEGLLAHPTSTRDRRGLVRWLLSRLVPE